MKEIVVNRDYGGFSVSHEAFLLLREMGNPTALEETDIGEYYDDGSGPREKMWSSFLYKIPRDDPQLIQVIKDKGSEFVSGQFAELEIVAIPDDVEWQIEEYDGFEWVAEKHRTWPEEE